MFGIPVRIQKMQNLCVSCSSYDLQYKSCQRNLMARKKRVNLTIPTSSNFIENVTIVDSLAHPGPICSFSIHIQHPWVMSNLLCF